jgi:hypothetical protein
VEGNVTVEGYNSSSAEDHNGIAMEIIFFFPVRGKEEEQNFVG